MQTAVIKIIDCFPFPTIPPILGTPIYNTIAKVNLKLNSNPPSVQSNLGCVTIALLQLTVSPVVYHNLSATHFIVPINRGSVPIIPSNSTVAQNTKLLYAFNTANTIFYEYNRTDKALRKMLLSTVNRIFIRYLLNKYIRYGLTTNRTILDHLCTT